MKSFVASINSTGIVEYRHRNPTTHHLLVVYNPATPKITARQRVSTFDLYGKSQEKVYNRPTSTCKDKSKERLMVLFCRKLIFPSHTTTNQILIYLASPKYV